jgi:hypothetical protein
MSARVIAGRYRLLREVGRGGMATVYLALDAKHDREVALKALRPDLAAAVGPVRFLQEIQITAGLNHPHVLPLLDSGDDEGLLYYVMPYVAGGSLRLLLSQRIPLAAAVRIVDEVASALDHAHSRGVIHRDVKPENILFNDGLAVVSDFGIARAMSGAADTRMTGTGLSVGTLGYMSPEQALGATELDERTDVYSLASVAFEMIVGETPSSWPGAEDVQLGRLSDLPDHHRARLSACPGRVEQVLARGLALRPAHRYASPGELARALAEAAQPGARYADEQVKRLLQRAAELQVETPEPDPGALTIGAVEQIAAQVGIPPSHVRRAAEELERTPTRPGGPQAPPVDTRPRPGGALGGDWRRLRADRWNRLVAVETVDGEVPESVFPVMAAEIQRRLDIPGHSSIVAGTLTWSPAQHSESTRKIIVQVSSADGRTGVRVQEELEIHGAQRAAIPVGGFAGLALTAGLAASLGVTDPGLGLAILAGAGGGVIATIRAVTGIAATDRAPQLEKLASALGDIARTTLGQEPAPEPAIQPRSGSRGALPHGPDGGS